MGVRSVYSGMNSATLAAALALFTAICFGLQAIVVESALDRARELAAPSFAAAFASVIVSVVAFWGLALARGVDPTALDPARLLPFVAAGVIYPAAFRLLYYEGIDRVGSSVAAAVVTANPAVATLIAAALFDARLTLAAGAGLLAIIGGGALLQFAGRAAGADAVDPILGRLSTAGARDFAYPVGAMLAVGAGYVLVDRGLAAFPNPIVATAVTQTAALAVFAAVAAVSPARRRSVRELPSHPKALRGILVAGGLVAFAWLGQFYSLRLGDLLVVLPLIYTYPLLVVAASYAGARRLPRSPRVVGAVAAIVAGVILVRIG